MTKIFCDVCGMELPVLSKDCSSHGALIQRYSLKDEDAHYCSLECLKKGIEGWDDWALDGSEITIVCELGRLPEKEE